MTRVRDLDPRLSHRLRAPAEPGALFPALFAHECESRKAAPRGKSFSESDVCAFTSTDYLSDGEDEECSWDIPWEWDSDDCGLNTLSEMEGEADRNNVVLATEEGNFEFDWDILGD